MTHASTRSSSAGYQSTERWRPIPGYEGRYEVSDHGRVRSLPRPYQRGCILRGERNEMGYLSVKLWRDGASREYRVNRLVATVFIRPPEPGEVCRHLNGDQTNDHVSNLAWGTPRENTADSRRLGRLGNQRKTHCSAGHEYTDENTMIVVRRSRTSRERVCRTCRRVNRARNESRQASTRSSSAGRQVSSGSTSGPIHNSANPAQPSGSWSLPNSHPARPSEQATGFGGTTREAPGRASAAISSRSSSSEGVGVHTAHTVGAA